MNTVTCSVDLPDGGPLSLSPERVADIAWRVGVPPMEQLCIDVILRHPGEKEQGYLGTTSHPDPSTWRIEIYVLVRPTYSDQAIYRLNNTLVHELRHVAQDAFQIPDGKWVEAEARTFGRLAHLPEYRAIDVVPIPETADVEWVCDKCGTVDLIDVIVDAMGTEPVYLHAEPGCAGTVAPTITEPS